MQKLIFTIFVISFLISPVIGEESLQEKLQNKISVNFVATPFSEVIQFLQEQVKLPLEFQKATTTDIESVRKNIKDLTNDNSQIRETAKTKLIELVRKEPEFIKYIEELKESEDIQIKWYADQIIKSISPEGKKYEPLITAKLKDVTTLSFLELVTYYQDMSFKITADKVVIHPNTDLGMENLSKFLELSYQNFSMLPSPPYPFSDPLWYKDINEKLQTSKVTVDFKDAPLLEVLDYIHQTTGLNIFVTDSTTERIISKKHKTTISFKEYTLEAALKLLLAMNRCKSILASEAVVIGEHDLRMPVMGKLLSKIQKIKNDFTPEALAIKAKRLADIQKMQEILFSTKIDVEFKETPLNEAVEYINTNTKIDIIIDTQIPKSELPRITFKQFNITLKNLFDIILPQYKFSYIIEPGTVIIVSSERRPEDEEMLKLQDKRITVPKGTNPAQLALILMKTFSKDVYIGEGAWNALKDMNVPEENWVYIDFINFLDNKIGVLTVFSGTDICLIKK